MFFPFFTGNGLSPTEYRSLPSSYAETECYMGYQEGHVAIVENGTEYPILIDPDTSSYWIEVNGQAMVLIYA